MNDCKPEVDGQFMYDECRLPAIAVWLGLAHI